jgi:hypothetical protein
MDSTRLAVALNYGLFFYEALNDFDRARRIHKAAFDSAYEHLDEIEGEEDQDSVLIMQLMRDATLCRDDIDDIEARLKARGEG